MVSLVADYVARVSVPERSQSTQNPFQVARHLPVHGALKAEAGNRLAIHSGKASFTRRMSPEDYPPLPACDDRAALTVPRITPAAHCRNPMRSVWTTVGTASMAPISRKLRRRPAKLECEW